MYLTSHERESLALQNPKERPILFSGEMVRAILDGRKTQTRRVIKIQPASPDHKFLTCVSTTGPKSDEGKHRWGKIVNYSTVETSQYFSCPFGKPGDRLWVRETWAHLLSEDCGGCVDCDGTPQEPCAHGYAEYRADQPNSKYPGGWDDNCDDNSECPKWRPSIHMPRWASRITLEITDVRVERLQDISEEDAKAEGLKSATKDGKLIKYGFDSWPWQSWQKDPRQAFRYLWGSVQTSPDETGWNGNPWVWLIEFKKVSGAT